jgi:general secretion pathway protein C
MLNKLAQTRLWVSGLAVLLTLAVLIWSGYSLARLFWLLVPDAAEGIAPPSVTRADNVATQSRSVDLALIAEAFTLTEASGLSASNMVSEAATADDTRLQLVLRGAVLSTEPSSSRAIIASGEQQQVYRPGDALQGTSAGVTLEQIFSDHVTLNNNGRIERLRLYDPAAASGSASSVAPVTAAQSSSVSTDTTEPVSGMDQAAELARVMRLQMVNLEGVAGLRIRHGSRADLLSNAGLAIGDIITAVDGTAINDLGQLQTLLSQLQQSQTVQLQVSRDGTLQTVNLNRATLGLP